MKRPSACFLVAALLLVVSGVSASDERIQELQQRLDNASGAERVEVLNALASNHARRSPERTVEYAEQALELARRLEDRPGEANALVQIGLGHGLLGSYDRSLGSLRDALEVYTELGDREGVATVHQGMGSVFWYRSDFDSALESFMESLRIREELADRVGVAKSLNDLGVVYKSSGDQAKALEYYERALGIREELDDLHGVAGTLNNIGIIHFESEAYDRALECYARSLEIKRELGDEKGTSNTLNNIGMVHLARGEPVQALDHYRRSLEIGKTIGDRHGSANALSNMARAQQALGRHDEARLALEEALEIATDIGSKGYAAEIHQSLSEVSAATGRWQQALDHLSVYAETKDEIFSEQLSTKVAEMQTRYEVEKSSREIVILHREKKIQQLQLDNQRGLKNLFAAISLFLVVVVGLVFLLYREKARASAQLAALNQVKDRLFSIISHDLRNPFQTLLARSRKLNEEYDDLGEDDRRHHASRIERSARTAYGLVENLLAWAEIERGASQPVVEPLNLHQVVVESVTPLTVLADEKRIGIEISVDESVFALAERYGVSIVIRNLVFNAIKFTDAGGSIEIASSMRGDTVEVIVSDTGIGMDQEQLGTLFRLARGPSRKGTAGESGSGLGLVLCKELVERNNGRIWATSEPGKGSRFGFSLPLRRG